MIKKILTHSNKIIFSILFVFIIACQTSTKTTLINNKSFEDNLKSHSKYDDRYLDFFNGNIFVESIYLSEQLIESYNQYVKDNNLNHENYYLPVKHNSNKMIFLVSFTAPKKDWTNLSEKDSIWNIVLKLGNKEITPSKRTIIKKNNDRINTFFTHQNSFSKIYLLEFDVEENINSDYLVVVKNVELSFFSNVKNLKILWEFAK